MLLVKYHKIHPINTYWAYNFLESTFSAVCWLKKSTLWKASTRKLTSLLRKSSNLFPTPTTTNRIESASSASSFKWSWWCNWSIKKSKCYASIREQLKLSSRNSLGWTITGQCILVAEIFLDLWKIWMVWFKILDAKGRICSFEWATYYSWLLIRLEWVKASPWIIFIKIVRNVSITHRCCWLKPAID